MLRSLKTCIVQRHCARTLMPMCTFLTNEYKCNEAWNVQISSPILTKVNLNDFYNILDQNFLSKGVISAIDVDIFANAVRDPAYLDELKDLLHKLRLSAETGNTLESTHHATIRNYMEFGNIQELIQILKDPLNFGVFLDFYSANILLDKLITSQSYEHASNVASFIMLQEDFTNDITNTLCQYACYKYVSEFKSTAEEPISPEDNKKKEEIKIRIKFLRNPYFDDHFDIRDLKTLSGKTLAWISKNSQDNLSYNLQIIGWLFYKKYEKLLLLCKELVEKNTFKLYMEVVEQINKEIESQQEEDTKAILSQCTDVLSKAAVTETKLEHSLKIAIENAINSTQNKDIAAQKQLFLNWEQIREDKLEEQSQRLDRANRIKHIIEKQKQMQVEEQKLWFFENEEDIDLQIEEKEKLEDTSTMKKTAQKKDDENYIPPEILPKRK